MKLRITNNPKTLAVFCLLEFINYTVTTTFFNQYTTLVDIILAAVLLLYYIIFIKHKHVSLLAFLIVAFIIIKCIFADNPLSCAERGSSLIIQVLLFYELPLSYLNENQGAYFRKRLIHYCSGILCITTTINFILILYGVLSRSYFFAGIKIGEPITGRYNGIFRTDAFCAESAFINVIFLMIRPQRNNKEFTIQCIISILTIVFSGTRAGMVAIVFLFFYLMLNKASGLSTAYRKLLLIIIGLLGIASMILLNFTIDIEYLSSSRWSIWISILQSVFEDVRILGSNDIEIPVLVNGKIFLGGAHNAYIQLIYNMGIPFFIIMMSYIFLKIRNGNRLGNALQTKGRRQLLAAIASIMVFNLFEAHLFFFRSLLSISFWFILMFLNMNDQESM